MDVDQPLLLFRIQFLQSLDPDLLKWPPTALLSQHDAQLFLYRYCFDELRQKNLPSRAYRFEVLKAILSRISKRPVGGVTPSPDGPIEELLSCLEFLKKTDDQSSTSVMQQDLVVTYNCVSQAAQLDMDVWRPLHLQETRSLNSGSKVTGYRTWEGALHLASFLVSQGSSIVGNKSVLELGAGTGFLSILCAKFLEAKRVTATDGDEQVVEAIRGNTELNDVAIEDKVVATKLWWGSSLAEAELQHPYDVVLGADIIYDPKAVPLLIDTISMLLDRNPETVVLMSAVVRKFQTFELFKETAAHKNLAIHEIAYQAVPSPRQNSLFYSTIFPLTIFKLVRHP